MDPLRAEWDFDDLDATERRFRARLDAASDGGARAEILTQLARVEGLRGDVGDGERLLCEAEATAGATAMARVRIDLERGRILLSGGDAAAALPYFESAFAAAREAGEGFLAADAAHMAALAASDRAGFVAWTKRGIELAESDDGARYWLGPLLNNLGWEHFGSGEHEEALDAFARALLAREEDPENAEPIALARYAVGKALRALGRPDEAAALVEQAVAWADAEGRPDGWYHEELAEIYAALGRGDDAREHASRALELLPAADPGFETDVERSTRLRKLADA